MCESIVKNEWSLRPQQIWKSKWKPIPPILRLLLPPLLHISRKCNHLCHMELIVVAQLVEEQLGWPVQAGSWTDAPRRRWVRLWRRRNLEFQRLRRLLPPSSPPCWMQAAHSRGNPGVACRLAREVRWPWIWNFFLEKAREDRKGRKEKTSKKRKPPPVAPSCQDSTTTLPK